ncbi:T9SS type A sorting domain-containing protein [Luteibaculum oceani]|uniref:T9SS type A sorting domain-containing protein n=1 Tax=Luteibaculum oceani TaxID=1294296 RepID=A0A5C6UZZ0_9FLAO|nr:T9SS type A sorting domain-containing protein [Luteibaculum oceani]TXC76225.1 T9SS type A sorting domain-containing protein [Luteibaculum oceani]
MQLKSIFFLLFLTAKFCFAQSPTPLDTGITINQLGKIEGLAVKLEYHQATDQLIYATILGDIYRIDKVGNSYISTLLYTKEDHGITQLQGMDLEGDLMVLSGNHFPQEFYTVGRIVKVDISSPNWKFEVLAETVLYETTPAFDHLFSGIKITRDNQRVIWCSGARGTHGEIQDYDGRFPNIRNHAFTSALLSVPLSVDSFIIQNDSTWLMENDVLFAYGSRNFFDFDYAPNGKLYAVENSGDRDDPEEMNEVIKGAHYGFPWDMGGNLNPQQFTPFDPSQDKMIHPDCRAMNLGLFTNDPSFPKKPDTLVITQGVKNYGPDADYFRNPGSGKIFKASNLGGYITTFTGHRSPLGFEFEKGNLSDGRYAGKAFMLSWTPGGDENRYVIKNGDTTGLGTFIDDSQDLVVISPKEGNSFDEIYTHQLIKGFSLPIDLVIARNRLYVIEYGGAEGNLYEVLFTPTTEIQNIEEIPSIALLPIPNYQDTYQLIGLRGKSIDIQLIDNSGKVISLKSNYQERDLLSLETFESGLYLVVASYGNQKIFQKQVRKL